MVNQSLNSMDSKKNGKNFKKVFERCYISLNKTPIDGDNGTLSFGGLRIGTPNMTTKGCLEEDFQTIAEFFFSPAQIASFVLKEHGKLQKELLEDFLN